MNKKLFPILYVAIGLLIISCSPPQTELRVRIVSDPVGGEDVDRLSCTFEGKLIPHEDELFSSGVARPITVTVEWWWENYYGYDDQVLSSETFTFSSESWTEVSTVLNAPFGAIFLNYFWVKITWQDDFGYKSVQSSKAFCFTWDTTCTNVTFVEIEREINARRLNDEKIEVGMASGRAVPCSDLMRYREY